jgi:hypothetical protein
MKANYPTPPLQKYDYLREFEAEFKKALASELFVEKTAGRKSRDIVPLNMEFFTY